MKKRHSDHIFIQGCYFGTTSGEEKHPTLLTGLTFNTLFFNISSKFKNYFDMERREISLKDDNPTAVYEANQNHVQFHTFLAS